MTQSKMQLLPAALEAGARSMRCRFRALLPDFEPRTKANEKEFEVQEFGGIVTGSTSPPQRHAVNFWQIPDLTSQERA